MTTDPTPSPRPAALVTDAMIAAFKRAFHLSKEATYEEGLRVGIAAALAASDAVLIPRAELEEAESAITYLDGAYAIQFGSRTIYDDLANRLRQRSRE